MAKKNKSVYYEAARRIAEGEEEFCCYAVAPRFAKIFRRIFNPSAEERMKYSDGNFVAWMGDIDDESSQLARSLALLFMHEMEVDE